MTSLGHGHPYLVSMTSLGHPNLVSMTSLALCNRHEEFFFKNQKRYENNFFQNFHHIYCDPEVVLLHIYQDVSAV